MLLWLLIIVILIIYGTRKRCSVTSTSLTIASVVGRLTLTCAEAIVDDVVIIEGTKSGSLITLILYAQNWLVTEDCYRGWSSTPVCLPPRSPTLC